MPTQRAFDLERFVTAQAPVFATALAELQAGEKRGHWMWLVFPQLRGLGRSAMAMRYGIGALDEARAYLAHPLLGPRLTGVTRSRRRAMPCPSQGRPRSGPWPMSSPNWPALSAPHP